MPGNKPCLNELLNWRASTVPVHPSIVISASQFICFYSAREIKKPPSVTWCDVALGHGPGTNGARLLAQVFPARPRQAKETEFKAPLRAEQDGWINSFSRVYFRLSDHSGST